MTTRKVKFKGVDYPIDYNMYVWKSWKQLTGREMSEIGELLRPDKAPSTEDLCDVLALVFCGIQASCKAENIEFDYDFDKFLMQCNPQEINNLTSSLSAIGAPESAKNTGQPKKATKK